MTEEKQKKPRGTAGMSPEVRKRVQSAGGKKISNDREWMREIGRRGGLSVSKNKAHMSEMGKKGAAVRNGKRKDKGTQDVSP